MASSLFLFFATLVMISSWPSSLSSAFVPTFVDTTTATSSSLQRQQRKKDHTHTPPTATTNIKMTSDDVVVTNSDATTDDISDNEKANSESEYSFFDEASIFVRAGSGGQGAQTFKKAKKKQDGIPDGGTGGVGGDIVCHVDPSLNTLASFTAIRNSASGTGRLQSFRAENGIDGGRMYDNGRGGEDCVVRVPPGTVVSIERERIFQEDEAEVEDVDDSTSSSIAGPNDEYDLQEIGTLTLDNPTLIVARGGKGGEGTGALKGKKSGATRRSPHGGERHRIRLTLKLIADVALCGVPNAGKSTFLAAVTRAEPKIANYPFTTVVPNIGVWIPGDNPNNRDSSSEGSSGRGGDKAAGSTGIVLCDVPGLIAGAADGVGLGHAFLRHVERCRVILHLVDATNEDPEGDFTMVNDEIRRYGNGNLAKMPQVVVVNKIDAWEEMGPKEFTRRKTELEAKLMATMGHSRLLWVSAKERKNVDELMLRINAYVLKIKESD
jgi:GTP-binding protein